ncbi:MAG: methyltransferase [Acidobacteriota bacterium]
MRFVEKRHDYARAEIEEILTPGPHRRPAPCPHYARCGGCDLQHLDDAQQLRRKVEAAAETLRRIGQLELPASAVRVVAGDPWGYRGRAQLHVGRDDDGQLAVGYRARGSHDLVAVSECPVLDPALEQVVRGLPQALAQLLPADADTALAAHEARQRAIRARDPRANDIAAAEAAKAARARRLDAGLDPDDAPRDGDGDHDGDPIAAFLPARVELALGDEGAWTSAPRLDGFPQGEVTTDVDGITYAYDARCFFQGHRGLLAELVRAVMALPGDDQDGTRVHPGQVASGDGSLSTEPAGASGGEQPEPSADDWADGETKAGPAAKENHRSGSGSDERGTVYDLYAGVGLFALPLARRGHRVIAIESDSMAVRYARRNARRNQLDDVEIVPQSVDTWIGDLPNDTARVIVDPPRAGLSKVVRGVLQRRPPRRLTYVSCNPATLARDLRQLRKRFVIEHLTFLDLFPQTAHLETVVQLRRRPADDRA